MSIAIYPTTLVLVETGVPIHNQAIPVQLSLIQQTTAVAHHQGHTLVIAKSVAFRVTRQKNVLPSDLSLLPPVNITTPLYGNHKQT
jgi:hypothetical protein